MGVGAATGRCGSCCRRDRSQGRIKRRHQGRQRAYGKGHGRAVGHVPCRPGLDIGSALSQRVLADQLCLKAPDARVQLRSWDGGVASPRCFTSARFRATRTIFSRRVQMTGPADGTPSAPLLRPISLFMLVTVPSNSLARSPGALGARFALGSNSTRRCRLCRR